MDIIYLFIYLLNIKYYKYVERLNTKIMSIYFQYPAIDEYPQLIYPLQTGTEKLTIIKDEDSLNKEQISELKDYLSLKQL